MDKILAEIAAERARQLALFGEETHPDIDEFIMFQLPSAAYARFMREQARVEGKSTWGHIATEEFAEVAEAATVGDQVSLRAELIQLGAVIEAWIECIDKRQNGDSQE